MQEQKPEALSQRFGSAQTKDTFLIVRTVNNLLREIHPRHIKFGYLYDHDIALHSSNRSHHPGWH